MSAAITVKDPATTTTTAAVTTALAAATTAPAAAVAADAKDSKAAPAAAATPATTTVAAAGHASVASAVEMKAQVIDGKELVPYYAIGSMMNITSMNLREIFPHKSVPGELKGYELVFKGLNGMASIDEKQGASLHGVLHYITCAQMAVLDRIEASYVRLWCDIHLYDGSVVKGWAYQMDHKRFPAMTSGVQNPPSERYIDVITRGAKHFGVKPEFIAWLSAVPQVPRRAPKDYRTIPDPDGVFASKTVTCAEFAKMDGNDGRPLGVSVNCKVMKFVGDLSTPAAQSTYNWAKNRFTGKDATLLYSHMLYEPLYPVCKSFAEMSTEQRAWCEDFYASNWTGLWAPVGRLSDMPADA